MLKSVIFSLIAVACLSFNFTFDNLKSEAETAFLALDLNQD